MEIIDARAIRRFLALPDSPDEAEAVVVRREDAGAYERRLLTIRCADGDDMPAYLLVPHGATGAPGVVVFHQHASQWHLGKSEVCGVAGDPSQAFGPALAAAGYVVLAPDAIGFEDRRRTTEGSQPHPDDDAQQQRELSYRLLHGGTLAAKVIADAETALAVLRQQEEVDDQWVGLLGHSLGGNTVIFQAALDPRVSFAASSGAAGTYRAKIANEIGIDRSEVIPGVVDRFDIDDLTRLIAPRPFAIFAGDDDRYAWDARTVIEATRREYERLGAADRFHAAVVPGDHRLTPERHRAIVDWLTAVEPGG